MSTVDNTKVKLDINLLKKKTERHYTTLNELIRDNNICLTMDTNVQLGRSNINFSNVDLVKIQNNTDKIIKTKITIKNNLTEIKLLSKQLLPMPITESEAIVYKAEIDSQKSETGDDY